MSLPPTLQALSIGARAAPHTLEVYVRAARPFSARMLKSMDEHVTPLLRGESAPFRDRVRVVLRPTPQPWHVASSLVHEAALAVARISLEDPAQLEDPATNAFWVYSNALMRVQERFFDDETRSKAPDQIRAELATFGVSTLGEDIRRAKRESVVRDLHGVPLGQAIRSWTRVGDGNKGSEIVPDLKYCVKIGRQNGIHVTPTALWNGVVEPSISSSFTAEQWRDFFAQHAAKL
ncbi:hypothetical protein MSPP1_000202 [Malassezia sp. CBS 17886]|nr:hypothetical protein MSPP1_000202 [Malassezia sp. CBS 17886]